MILCLCGNINEQEWATALSNHDHDVQAAQHACGAGQCCGTCVPTLMERVAVRLAPRHSGPSLVCLNG